MKLSPISHTEFMDNTEKIKRSNTFKIKCSKLEDGILEKSSINETMNQRQMTGDIPGDNVRNNTTQSTSTCT